MHRTTAALAATAALTAAASASITSIDDTFFGVEATVITFDEVPVGTSGPFDIGAASFGSTVITQDSLGAEPPAPSGVPYAFSTSVGVDDIIEVSFAYGLTAVGAYFDLTGGGRTVGAMTLEFYNADTLLGTVDAIPTTGNGGFVGGQTDGTLITRIVFRDTDPTSGISFRIDDLTFIPTPAAATLLALATPLTLRRRR